MKYIVSVFIGGAIAYIQSISSKGKSDFLQGIQPVMFHFIAAAFGIGLLGAMKDDESFMNLITPYFGFGLAAGLVVGKLFFIFYNKSLIRK